MAFGVRSTGLGLFLRRKYSSKKSLMDRRDFGNRFWNALNSARTAAEKHITSPLFRA